jgi:hypothetical protein
MFVELEDVGIEDGDGLLEIWLVFERIAKLFKAP